MPKLIGDEEIDENSVAPLTEENTADAGAPRVDQPCEALGYQALQVVLHIAPPSGDDARDLKVVEQAGRPVPTA